MLDDNDLVYVGECLAEAVKDTEEPITYRTFNGMTHGDPIHGTPDTPSYTDTIETATARELSLEEVQKSGGAYFLGDMGFTTRRATKPKYEDRIVYDGLTWKPKSIGHVYLGSVLWWKIKAGRE